MVTSWMIRVDIDTLEGLKKGIPILLGLSKKFNIKMTFFFPFGGFQTGKNVFRIIKSRERIRRVNKKQLKNFNPFQLLKSTFNIEKDYSSLFKQFKEPILSLGNEIALHGYKHYDWMNNLHSYNQETQESLLLAGFKEFQNTFKFSPKGFAAPGFQITEFIMEKIQKLPFSYGSNYYLESNLYVKNNYVEIPVNFPLIEELLEKGKKEKEVIDYYIDRKEKYKIIKNKYILFYLHPLKEPIANLEVLSSIIENFKLDNLLENETMYEFSRKIIKNNLY